MTKKMKRIMAFVLFALIIATMTTVVLVINKDEPLQVKELPTTEAETKIQTTEEAKIEDTEQETEEQTTEQATTEAEKEQADGQITQEKPEQPQPTAHAPIMQPQPATQTPATQEPTTQTPATEAQIPQEPTTQAPATQTPPAYQQVWVVDVPAWDEEIPVMELRCRAMCNQCGHYMYNQEEVYNHYCVAGTPCGGHHSDYYEVQVGTEIVHHDEIGHWEDRPVI